MSLIYLFTCLRHFLISVSQRETRWHLSFCVRVMRRSELKKDVRVTPKLSTQSTCTHELKALRANFGKEPFSSVDGRSPSIYWRYTRTKRLRVIDEMKNQLILYFFHSKSRREQEREKIELENRNWLFRGFGSKENHFARQFYFSLSPSYDTHTLSFSLSLTQSESLESLRLI